MEGCALVKVNGIEICTSLGKKKLEYNVGSQLCGDVKTAAQISGVQLITRSTQQTHMDSVSSGHTKPIGPICRAGK
ncbi:uncharacterized protein N7515_000385 [Penicillium bovifimosum]|uniref:Uncharacterized protein n=1 Tax=Penicillium bovifimosum TaxID=126998 RepID=A0A9W9HEV8_9EURO|nr:uncharacterized protein N7515_000385 [Penicillium bovifimosum]KAJ5145821.1 hypothetical protein N7515_000385 [Penicillium bovifimosum]